MNTFTRVIIVCVALALIFLLFLVQKPASTGPTPEPVVAQSIVSSEADQTASREAALKRQFHTFQLLPLSSPVYVDLTGDGAVEQAVFTALNGKQGIQITDGKSKRVTSLGLGNNFPPAGDSFDWVDYWGITTDSVAGETVIENGEVTGERDVKLEHPALILREDEAGGGLIVWRNNRYTWVHQSD